MDKFILTWPVSCGDKALLSIIYSIFLVLTNWLVITALLHFNLYTWITDMWGTQVHRVPRGCHQYHSQGKWGLPACRNKIVNITVNQLIWNFLHCYAFLKCNFDWKKLQLFLKTNEINQNVMRNCIWTHLLISFYYRQLVTFVAVCELCCITLLQRQTKFNRLYMWLFNWLIFITVTTHDYLWAKHAIWKSVTWDSLR